MQNHHLNLFIHVHFFGLYRYMHKPVLKALRKSDVLIIEDCVHSLAYPSKTPPFGDVLIFSLYKHLSLPYGSIGIFRKSLTDTIHDLQKFITSFDGHNFSDTSHKLYLWFKWIFKVFLFHPLRIFNSPRSLPLFEHSSSYKLFSAFPNRFITALAYTQFSSSWAKLIHKFNYDLYSFYLPLHFPVPPLTTIPLTRI